MLRRTVLVAVGVVGASALLVVVMLMGRLVLPAPAAEPTTAAPGASTSPRPAEADARSRAFAAAVAFCRPDVDSGTWQRALDPYLSADARVLYAATAPVNIPCASVRDVGGPVGDQQTPTDTAWQFDASTGGPVTVTLHRGSAHSAWEVSYIDAGGTS
jgi:hypothetical protein